MTRYKGMWMFCVRSLTLFVIFAAASLLSGCAPSVLCTVETEVYPDYTVARVTRLEAQPNPRFPGQRPRLAEYFQFPPAELYDSYVVQQDKVLFAGMFESFDQLPSDLVRATPGANSLAGNLYSFRVMDLVLFVWADFDETITDIVTSREDGEAAMQELVRLAVPEVMSVLNAKYGAKYDLSRLESWLNNDLPAKLRRLYTGAWDIHAAKRSGVTSPGEDYEFYMFLKAEAKREGLELAEPGHPDLEQENLRRLKEYGTRLARTLLIPRQGGTISEQELAGIALDELVASIQKAITARHGSVNNFVGKIAALVPRAFGAYMTGTMMPIYMLPETTYQYRLRLPGTVIQTNAVRELNGDLVWNFADRDLAFTGQSMWARSVFIREPAVNALGLRGFPASLGDVDKLFGLCLGPDGQPREEILKALAQAVAVRGVGPLESIAANSQSQNAASAKGILELFERHRRSPSQPQPRQPAAEQPPSPPAAQQPSPQAAQQPPSPPAAAAPAKPERQPAQTIQIPPAQTQSQTQAAPRQQLSAPPPMPEPEPTTYGGRTSPVGTGTPPAAAPSSPVAVPPLPSLEPVPQAGTSSPASGQKPPPSLPPPLPEPEPTATPSVPRPTASGFGGIEPPSLPPPVR